MKKINQSVLMFIGVLLFAACSDSPSNLIVGEWIQKDKATEDRLVEFKSDGKLIMHLIESEKRNGVPDSLLGTWELSDDNRLKMVVADSPVLARIESISEMEMIIKFDKDKHPMLYKRKEN